MDGLSGNLAAQRRRGAFLELLACRSHQVLSGLALVGPGEGEERSGTCASTVTFGEIADAEVERYLASGEWRGRAGGYAIQGLGSTLVAAVEGDYRKRHRPAGRAAPGARAGALALVPIGTRKSANWASSMVR